MNALDTMKILVCAAAIFCLGSIGYRVYTAPDIYPALTSVVATSDAATAALKSLPVALRHVQTTSDAATGLLYAARPAVVKLNSAIDLTSHRLNDICPGVTEAARPCGTLADANRTLATLRGTSGQVERSLFTFNRHEEELFVQEGAAYDQFQTSMRHFDGLVGDPNLPAIVMNARLMSDDAAGMTHDGREWFHGKLYPTKRKGFVSGFEATGDAVRHWMPPLF